MAELSKSDNSLTIDESDKGSTDEQPLPNLMQDFLTQQALTPLQPIQNTTATRSTDNTESSFKNSVEALVTEHNPPSKTDISILEKSASASQANAMTQDGTSPSFPMNLSSAANQAQQATMTELKSS